MDLNRIIAGLSKELEKTVVEADSAERYGSGLVPVFSTPALVAFMEQCANESVQDQLPEDYVTVGTEINIKHLKATAIGDKVKCKAMLYAVDGRKLLFNIKAWDSAGEIGIATHTRFIVNKKKFLENIAPKSG